MPSLQTDPDDNSPSDAVAKAMLTHNSGRGSMARVKAAFDRRILEEKKRAAALTHSSTAPVSVQHASCPPQHLTYISVVRPSKDTKLGLTIKQTGAAVLVSKLSPNSLFLGSALREGMILQSINGIGYKSFQDVVKLLSEAEGKIDIVASSSSSPSMPITTSNHASKKTSHQADQDAKILFRQGRFSPEEIQYVNLLIKLFKDGLLPLTNEISLGVFLSKTLNCKKDRVIASKHFKDRLQRLGYQYDRYQRNDCAIALQSPEVIDKNISDLRRWAKAFMYIPSDMDDPYSSSRLCDNMDIQKNAIVIRQDLENKKVGKGLDVVTKPETIHHQPLNTLQQMNNNALESSFSSCDLENQVPDIKKIKPNNTPIKNDSSRSLEARQPLKVLQPTDSNLYYNYALSYYHQTQSQHKNQVFQSLPH